MALTNRSYENTTSSCSYEHTYFVNKNKKLTTFKCDQVRLGDSNYCLFHDEHYLKDGNYRDNEGIVKRRLYRKIENNLIDSRPIICIGYHLPEIYINKELKQSIYFNNCVFQGIANFANSTFFAEVMFSGATFNHMAIFLEVPFLGYATFFDSWFHKEANFSSSKFKSEAIFSSTKFLNKSSFVKATFSDMAKLNAQFTLEPTLVKLHSLLIHILVTPPFQTRQSLQIQRS